MTKVKVECGKCGKPFNVPLKKYNAYIKNGYNFYCSDTCRKNKGKIQKTCASCGKIIYRTQSQINKTKHGNVFCNKSCSASYTNKLNIRTGENHPNYINGSNGYRERALKVYIHKCAVCGWDKDNRILEVHHIDSNRDNNSLENLIVLCPICHRKITLGLHELKNRKILLEKCADSSAE